MRKILPMQKVSWIPSDEQDRRRIPTEPKEEILWVDRRAASVKLSDEQALDIIERCRNNESVSEIADHYGVNYHVAYRIATGKTYKHLHGGAVNRISEADEGRIVFLVKEGYSSIAVAKKMNVSVTAVSKVFKRVTGESVSCYRKRKGVKYGQEI